MVHGNRRVFVCARSRSSPALYEYVVRTLIYPERFNLSAESPWATDSKQLEGTRAQDYLDHVPRYQCHFQRGVCVFCQPWWKSTPKRRTSVFCSQPRPHFCQFYLVDVAKHCFRENQSIRDFFFIWETKPSASF